MSDDLAYKIGRAYGGLLRNRGLFDIKKWVVVGYDMRPSSVGYSEAVRNALRDEGFNVVDVGLVTTPLFNFACAHYRIIWLELWLLLHTIQPSTMALK